jgi:omega-amidase
LIVNAGILQFDVKRGDIAANMNAARGGIRRLAARGADLVVLPEMWSCGFDLPNLSAHALKSPEILNILSDLAGEHHLVVAGSLPETADGSIYNSMYVIDINGVVSPPYRKMHLFRPTGEDRHFTAGEHPVICPTDIGVLGLMICYDLRFPELCRLLALRGAGIILVSAQWPSRRIHHWDALLRARAIENQMFVVASNRCGRENNLAFTGHSQIISPQGDVLCLLGETDSEGLAAIDLAEITQFRALFDTVRERRLTVSVSELSNV